MTIASLREHRSDSAAFRLYRFVRRVPRWRFWLTEHERREARQMWIRYAVEHQVELLARKEGGE